MDPNTVTLDDPNAIYIEDIYTRLADSSDSNPIALLNITATQFRHYLLAIFGLSVTLFAPAQL
jgi:hypothetical protein